MTQKSWHLPPIPTVADWLACRGGPARRPVDEAMFAVVRQCVPNDRLALEYLRGLASYFAALVNGDAETRRRSRRQLDKAAARVRADVHLHLVAFVVLGGDLEGLDQ